MFGSWRGCCVYGGVKIRFGVKQIKRLRIWIVLWSAELQDWENVRGTILQERGFIYYKGLWGITKVNNSNLGQTLGKKYNKKNTNNV